jgi:transposase
MFVFTSRRRKSIKILCYDGQGYFLCQKRLSQGRYAWWPTATGQPTYRLEARQMQVLLWNGHPESTTTAPLWKPVQPAG